MSGPQPHVEGAHDIGRDEAIAFFTSRGLSERAAHDLLRGASMPGWADRHSSRDGSVTWLARFAGDERWNVSVIRI